MKLKDKDTVECLQLQSHRFHLVEDECLKEARIIGRIIKVASTTTSSSSLKKVRKTKPKGKVRFIFNKKKCVPPREVADEVEAQAKDRIIAGKVAESVDVEDEGIAAVAACGLVSVWRSRRADHPLGRLLHNARSAM